MGKVVDIEPGLALTDTQVFRLITSLEKRFNGQSGINSGTPDAQTFAGRVDWRRTHYHNLEAANPQLSAPWDEGNKYQTDLLRRKGVEMVSRLTENPVTIDVSSPKETSSTSSEGDDFATVLTEIWRDVQARLGINIQEAVSNGQVAEAFGLVHLRMDADLIPEVEDYEELDALPDCQMCEGTKKAAGKRCPECKGTGLDLSEAAKYKHDPAGGKYRETDKALQARTAQKRAAAGSPFYIETPDIAGFMWSKDRTAKPGLATCCLVRTVGLLDYCDANGDAPTGDGELRDTSLSEQNADIGAGEEREAPRAWMPSWFNWNGETNNEITVYEFWTRTEYYEVVRYDHGGGGGDESGMVLRKAFKHPYKKPPFFLIPAVVNNSADPILRYEPYLEGVYRIKPFHDRKMALLDVMAEKVALSYYYWRNVTTGAPMLGEDGTIEIVFERDSARANVAPPGYELFKAEDVVIHPAFVDSVKHTAEELLDAAPPTGAAEVTATTQPFAIKLQQEQASVVLRAGLRNQVAGYQEMMEMIAHLLSLPAQDGGYGETLYVNPSKVMPDGRRITDRSKTIGVDPKIIPTLTINVNISGTSQAEQTTKTQIGIQILGQPEIPLTKKYVLQNYFGLERPEDMLSDFEAQTTFEAKIMPGLRDQKLAQKFGGIYVVAPDGQAVGFGGKSATPYDVLADNGITPVVPQGGGMSAPPGMSPAPGAPPAPPPVAMGASAPMAVPGSLPTPGMQG